MKTLNELLEENIKELAELRQYKGILYDDEWDYYDYLNGDNNFELKKEVV